MIFQVRDGFLRRSFNGIFLYVFLPVLLAFVLVPGTVLSETVKEPASDVRIMIQRFVTAGADTEEATTLEEAVVLEIVKKPGYRVITPAEIEQIQGKTGEKEFASCVSSPRCIGELAGKVSAGLLLTGKLGLLGDELVFTMSLMDTKSAHVILRVAAQAKTVLELKKLVPELVSELVEKRQKKVSGFEVTDLRLAVMPLVARGVKEETADAMTQILAAELNRVKGVTVMGRDDIKAMLEKISLQSKMNCAESMQCVVEIGAALGLSKLVTGVVGKIGSSFVLSLKLIDTRKTEVLNRVLETFDGDESELKNAVKLAAYELLGVEGDATGGVDFSLNVKNASFKLGDLSGETSGGHLSKEGLKPGRYSLNITPVSGDLLPLQTDVYVVPGEENIKSISLREKPPKWYQTWWFWTITGVVVAGVAGGVTYGVLQSSSAPLGGGSVSVGK